MSIAYPRPATPEPITHVLVDDEGAPVSGASVVVRVRRADGLWLDWADGSYGARASAVQLDEPMPELDEPGVYETSWPGGSDGTRYKALVAVDGVVRGVVEIHVGGLAAPGDAMTLEAEAVAAVQEGLATSNALADVASDAEIARKALDNRQEVDAVGGGRCITYDDDGETPWRTRTLRDGSGNAIVLGAGVPARRGAPT